MIATSVRRTWSAELGTRARRHFLLTLIGTTAFTFVFFVGYLYIQRHPAYPLTVMPLTVLDRLIPFQPHALFAYLSLWVYVGVGPGLQRTRTDILVYTAWMGALCLVGLGIFYFLPTQVPPPILDVSKSVGFAMLRQLDAAGNACPSMHVAVALFTAVRIDDVLRCARSPTPLRLANAACFAAIAYSTLAVKQHVVLDVVAGALMGAVFVLLSLRWRPDHGYDASYEGQR